MSAFSACQVREDPIPEVAYPALDLALEGDCVVGEQRGFELEAVDPGKYWPEADYGYQLVTADPYYLDECLCEVTFYKIDFDWLPEANDVDVTDHNGQSISYQIHQDFTSGTFTIFIPASELEDATFAVFIEVDGVQAPAVIRSGGLCIVNNLGGGDHPTPSYLPRTTPYWVYNNAPPAPLVNRIFIPTSMTTSK